jgi:hypothetical protein
MRAAAAEAINFTAAASSSLSKTSPPNPRLFSPAIIERKREDGGIYQGNYVHPSHERKNLFKQGATSDAILHLFSRFAIPLWGVIKCVM